MLWVMMMGLGIYMVVATALNKLPSWLADQNRTFVMVLGAVIGCAGLGLTLAT